MQHKNYIIFLSFVFFGLEMSAGPGTYYSTIDSSKSCANFKTQLYHLISSTAASILYSQVDNYYNITDSKPAETGGGSVIVDRYSSDIPTGLDSCNFRYPTGFCGSTTASSQCVCYQKEHVFPSSWFGGTTMYPYYTDMHFIWPADGFTNFKKGNVPLGYVNSPTYTSYNGSKVGTSKTASNFGYNSSLVFEPNDAFKGDFARAYLYFVTRFEDSIPSLPGRSTSGNVLDGTKYPAFKPWILQLCVKWSKQDPPSAFEIKRNDDVFSLQGNRNPYIDYPHWVEKAFGLNGNYAACVTTDVRTNKSVDFSVYPNPANNVLNIRFANSMLANKEGTLEIIDIVGKVILQQSVHLNKETETIDVSHLSKGIYLINVRSDEQNNVTTFVKQ